MSHRWPQARIPGRPSLGAVVAVALLLGGPRPCVAAQPAAALPDYTEGAGLLGVARIPPSAARRQVRVSLEEHRLYVMEGERVVWSARIGTGTGDRLEGRGQSWDFSTPPGRYRIQRKDLDPVWFLPDWAFVERGEAVPPVDSPERRVESALGAAALYLGNDIAIHGTDQPESLGEAVSHGCIRMSNDDVLRLHDELEVGSVVIIQ